MARPPREPPCSSAVVPALLRYARARDLDVPLLASGVGLPADADESDEVTVAPGAPRDLLEALARACGDAAIGLRLAEDLPRKKYGFGDLAARASATVGDALERLARYVALLHGACEAALTLDAGEGRWTLRTPGQPRGLGRALHELVVGSAVAQCRVAASVPLPVRGVWFAHARPADLSPVTTFFGVGADAIRFGCEDSGFAIDGAVLAAPMATGDERMLATVEPLAEAALRGRAPAPSLSKRVAAILESRLLDAAGARGADVEEAAEALHMSARTLQRRLEEEGSRYSDLLDRVRLTIAQRLLRDRSVTIADVAFRLGFSDIASFGRAFKRWTGKAPGQWRHG